MVESRAAHHQRILSSAGRDGFLWRVHFINMCAHTRFCLCMHVQFLFTFLPVLTENLSVPTPGDVIIFLSLSCIFMCFQLRIKNEFITTSMRKKILQLLRENAAVMFRSIKNIYIYILAGRACSVTTELKEHVTLWKRPKQSKEWALIGNCFTNRNRLTPYSLANSIFKKYVSKMYYSFLF